METSRFSDAGYTTTEWYQRTVVDRYELRHLQYEPVPLGTRPQLTTKHLVVTVGNAATPATTYRRLSDLAHGGTAGGASSRPNTNAAYMH